MPHSSRFVCVLTFILGSVLALNAQTGSAQPVPPASPSQPHLTIWQSAVQNFPLLRFLVHFFEPAQETPSSSADRAAANTHPLPSLGTCSVAPLDPIEDPAARQLEAARGSDGVVDVSNMLPAAARALTLFEQRVANAGGTMVLKSAYRPPAYQKHLQDVWYKWMHELRNNQDPACQDLRAQVQDEFTGHHLIETQHPVSVSDHTRGIAFDATVELPAKAKIGRRRMTLDGLARLAGLLRPAIAADPVHFKYFGGTFSAARRATVARVTGTRRPRSA